MKLTVFALTLPVAVLVGGCASTSRGVASTVISPQASLPSGSLSPDLSPNSIALATYGDAINCILGQTDGTHCSDLARAAGTSATALQQATPSAIEQLSERGSRQARAENIPISVRTSLAQWFDLAVGAAREARTATVSHSTSDVRAHGQLQALFAFVPEAGVLGPDVEASALLVLAKRIELATQAPSQIREEAFNAVTDLLHSLSTGIATSDRSGGPEAQARQNNNGALALAQARQLVSERLTSVTPRVLSRALHASAEQRAESMQVARR